MTYSGVFIIYNPNSTGDSQSMAEDLASVISDLHPELLATQHAGHARELAREISKRQKQPLIVSASGDGGYNEVVNGVMESGNQNAICAVLPAGNANDHSRTMHSKPLKEQILKRKVSKIDLIKVSTGDWTRYAHSYIGLGLTPVVAAELNRHTLNALRETWLAVKTFLKYRPFKIRHRGKTIQLDSILFANINQMAKLLTLAPANRPDDGKFEVVIFPAGRKVALLKRLSKAAVSKLESKSRASHYKFEVIKNMPMQLDGEVTKLKAGDTVTVTCEHRVLRTIV